MMVDRSRMTRGEQDAYDLGRAQGFDAARKAAVPGWRTSEFWMTLVTTVYSGLFGLIVLLRPDIDIERAMTVAGLVGIGGAAGAYYTKKRADIKAQS